MKKFLLASALILSATAASAQGFYAGVQYAGVQLEEDTTTLNADLNGLGVVAGYHFNEHFALEGRYLGGVGSDTVLGFKTELDDYVGINVVGSVPIQDGFSVYASAGIGRASATASDGTETIRVSDTSMAYGVGVQYKMTNYTVRGGLESFYDKDTFSAQGVTITVARHF